ncbi:MAG: PqqD family protein [Elusimicrobia bacterium]|nr:PqqD family protein [Elusimicrobiota bacterium]
MKGYRINKDIVSRMIRGKYYLVDPRGHILHSVNETGSMIFDSIRKNRSITQIIDMVCDEYDIDRRAAKEDTEEFLELLKGKNILIPS